VQNQISGDRLAGGVMFLWRQFRCQPHIRKRRDTKSGGQYSQLLGLEDN